MTRYVRSGVIQTPDGSSWVLELRPKSHAEFQAKLVVHAIETSHESQQGFLRRKLLIKPIIHHQNTGQRVFEKDVEEAFFVKEDEVSELVYQRTKMISFSHKAAITNLLTQCLAVQLILTPRTFIWQDYEEFKENQKKRGVKI